jgi:hypothetical protein
VQNDDGGSYVDVSIIKNIKLVEFKYVHFESDDFESDDDTNNDEAYINDDHVAPLEQEDMDDDHGFFV